MGVRMLRHALAAAALLATIPAAAPAFAQSQQDTLESRYDRALAGGYKALFLCSAVANAERAGAERSVQSIENWELAGIQAPLDELIDELPAKIIRDDTGLVEGVMVEWDQNSPPRVAMHHVGRGCRTAPIGATFERMQDSLSGPMRPTIAERNNATGFLEGTGTLPEELGAAFDGKTYGEGTRSTAALIVRNRQLVAERYADGFGPDVPQRTWSVAKSIAATLVGAAVVQGDIAVTGSAGLGERDGDPRRAITIDHLLRMASGRYSDTAGNRTDPLYFGGSTVEETALHWPLIHAPGSVYRYANNDTLAAIKAIEEAFDDHSPAEFFVRLGMHDTVAETDWQGDYILSSQVWSTARDLSRLGQLYLDDGVLPTGQRVLPDWWLDYVSSPSGPQPDNGFGYGAGFWLFNQHEGIPRDTFAAMGNRGQYVVIVPSMDVIIVRRGEDPSGSRFDIVAFTRDVLKTLEN